LRRTAAGGVFGFWAIVMGAGMARADTPSCADLRRAKREKVYGFHLTQLNENAD